MSQGISQAGGLQGTAGPSPAGILQEPAARVVAAYPWIFSARVDLAVFGGSALLSMLLILVARWTGLLNSEAPEWTWIVGVLLVDVAHVYATAFRVYLEPRELKRRPWLYVLTPLMGLLLGVALYSQGESVFWRALAYLAVCHFVRQQYGWVAWYRSKAGERGRLGWWIDASAIYLATLYPLIYWHSHLPRRFWWFVADDFVAIPAALERLVQPIYWLALIAYAARSFFLALFQHRWNPGKDLVVATTVMCWYVGIVALNSDFAFTVTNVFIHGVPYIVLVYWTNRRMGAAEAASEPTAAPASVARFSIWKMGASWLPYLGILWMLAYGEELLWDRGVWHERSWLFGQSKPVAESWRMLLVPLLALPQLTHYVLDGFIWKRKSNPDLHRTL